MTTEDQMKHILWVLIRIASVIQRIFLWEIIPKLSSNTHHMSRDMTKPTKWLCPQWRLRSAWASTQSDQSLRAQADQCLRCPHEESLGP